MEDWGPISSPPSNLVGIVHLRERWLKENEQKQEEEEEQEQPEQRVQQEQKVHVQPTEHEEKNDQKPQDVKPVVQKPRIHTTTRSKNRRRKISRYNRAVLASNPCNVNQTCKKNEDVGEPRLAIPPIESDGKKKKSGRKKKPRAQNEEIDRTLRTPEENLEEELRETECEVEE